MPDSVVDLRSDTFTQPTAAMREAMARAVVGDDVFDEDPTIHALQDRVADMLGKEAAIFVPSGTMSNQIGVRLHCGPGDEFICEAGCHIYNYEQGAYAQFFGVAARAVEGRDNVLELAQMTDLIRGDNDHLVRTRMVCLENTHNRGGGCVLPFEGVAAICDWARGAGLATHLDGARLFNAVVATGIPAAKWAAHFDTVSVCFSKGLGAPVGSALVGSKEQIRQARRVRKALGGGMRQAGVLAAGALHALEHHVERLKDDHANARLLADAVRGAPGLRLRPERVESNIVIFDYEGPQPTGPGGAAAQFVAALAEQGVRILAIGSKRMRAVTHLDVSRDEVEQAAKTIGEVARLFADGTPTKPRAAGTVYA